MPEYSHIHEANKKTRQDYTSDGESYCIRDFEPIEKTT